MPGDYDPLFDADPVRAFDPDSKFVHREKVKGTLKTVAATGWGLGFSVAHIPVVGSLPAIASGVKTAGHIRNLQTIRTNLAHECICNGCDRLIEYAITQKEWKLGKKVASVVPVVGTVVAVGSKLRAAQKWKTDSLGRARSTAAVMLWHSAREGCQMAQAVLSELLGGPGRAEEARRDANGYQTIFKKLAST
jgi:hypothetical protein